MPDNATPGGLPLPVCSGANAIEVMICRGTKNSERSHQDRADEDKRGADSEEVKTWSKVHAQSSLELR